MRRSNARRSSLKVAAVDPDSDPNQSTTTSAYMDDSMKLQFRPNQPIRSTNLFSRNPRYNNSKSNFIFLALIATFIALCCYSLFIGSRASEKRRFGIVIDGGSTGTRIHVFEYLVRDGRPVFDFGEIGLVSMRVSPGLSAFAEEPEVAGGSLVELVEFARKRVSKEVWGKTEVRLMATAGLRLSKVGLQEQVLESCRRVLRVSGFKFHDDLIKISSYKWHVTRTW